MNKETAMNHPYVYEMQTRQKIEILTREGLRSQQLKQRKQEAVKRTEQRQPIEAPESAPRKYWIVATLHGWVRRIAWGNPSRINIQL